MIKGKEFMIKRILLGIKGQEIAKMIGVDQSYISKMENERQEIPPHIYKKWVQIFEN